MSVQKNEETDIGCDPNDIEAVQARLAKTLGRLVHVLESMHSPEEAERHSALSSALGSFRLINKIAKVLNPNPTPENPQIEYSFPTLYRMADQSGLPQDEVVLAKLEEFAQANEELKAREELLLADRRRLEILIQQSGKEGRAALFAQRDKLKATLDSADKTINAFASDLDTVLQSLQGVLEQAQSEHGIPDLYADWMTAIDNVYIPIRSLSQQKQPWLRTRLLKAAGMPVSASEVLVMKAMIKAQDEALTSKTSGGLLRATLDRVSEFSQSLAHFQNMVAVMQSRFASQLGSEEVPEAKELMDLLANAQKSIQKQNEIIDDKTQAVLKAQEERDRAITERDEAKQRQERDKKNYEGALSSLRQRTEDSVLTKRRKRFAERAIAYRADKKNLNQQLALLNEFLAEIFTPEMVERLQSDEVDTKLREDMAELARQKITPEQLSKLIVRGFELKTLEKKLRVVFEDHAELKKRADGWKELVTLFSKGTGLYGKLGEYLLPPLLITFGALIAGASNGGNPFSSIFFTGIVGGSLASGAHNFFKTIINFDSIQESLPDNQKIKVSSFSAASRAFRNGLLPGALAGCIGGVGFQFAVERDVYGEKVHQQQLSQKNTKALTSASSAYSINDNNNKVVTDPFKDTIKPAQAASSPIAGKSPVMIIFPSNFYLSDEWSKLCGKVSTAGHTVYCLKDGTPSPR